MKNHLPAQSWLWPDRVIGKRESRTLRDEHNALVNSHADLLEQLKALVGDLEWGTTNRWKGDGSKSIRTAIAKAEGRQP